MSDQKGEVQFNLPPDQVLRERQESRKGAVQSAKRERAPLGGAPEVQIPPLQAQPLEAGGTMHQQASTLKDPTSPLSPAYNPQLAHMATAGGPQGGPFAPLPPEAAKDPRFRQGVGSMIAGNQPQLKQSPGQPQPETDEDGYKPHLSDETRQSMEALAQFHERADTHQKVELEQKRKEGKADTSVLAEGEDESFQDELKQILGDNQLWNKLNNPERRKEIEGRLEPMDLMDIIMEGEVRQDVPVRPGKFEVSFRSVSGEEDLAVKRMMTSEEGGDRYLMDKFTMMNLCLGTVAINNRPLPTHLSDKKEFDEERFLEKFNRMIKFPLQLLADLGVQYMWFDDRVRDLFIGETETLKNS